MRISSLFIIGFLLTACRVAQPKNEQPDDISAQPSPVIQEDLALDWVITPQPDGAFDQPNTAVALKLSGAMEQTIDLGTYAGTFADGRELSVGIPDDVLLMGILWFAGGGDEFVIKRSTPETLQIFHRVVDEQVEPGEYELMQELAIPAEANIELAPWRDQ